MEGEGKEAQDSPEGLHCRSPNQGRMPFPARPQVVGINCRPHPDWLNPPPLVYRAPTVRQHPQPWSWRRPLKSHSWPHHGSHLCTVGPSKVSERKQLTSYFWGHACCVGIQEQNAGEPRREEAEEGAQSRLSDPPPWPPNPKMPLQRGRSRLLPAPRSLPGLPPGARLSHMGTESS